MWLLALQNTKPGMRLCDLPDTVIKPCFPSSWSEGNASSNEKQESLQYDLWRINKNAIKSYTHQPPLQSAEIVKKRW